MKSRNKTPPGAAAASLLVARLVLERDPQPHPETGHLPILDHDVLPHHLGHAQVTNGVGRGLHGASSRRLPRLVADTDHLGHSVHTFRHGCLLCFAVSALPVARKDARAPFLSRSPLDRSYPGWGRDTGINGGSF